jgi:hypothetical protein
MSKNRKDKIEKSVLVKGAVICIAVVAISFSLIPGLAAQGTGDSVNVNVTVNAPKYVEGTFNASIDVDSVTNFNSGQFDLSFDSSVVNVTDVVDGSLDGETIPVSDWERLDKDTIRVLLEVPGIIGVNGSGNLATISFEVAGKGGDKSVLDISKGILYNNEAEKIPTEWINDEVIVGPVRVKVNAPETAKIGETFVATVDVDSVANLNIAQFDLSFNSSVVNVTEVTNGNIDGTAIPCEWDFVDSETIRVISELPENSGVSGSGYLATINFAVKGEEGDESVLNIANGVLGNNIAEEIPAEWIDAKVTLIIE